MGAQNPAMQQQLQMMMGGGQPQEEQPLPLFRRDLEMYEAPQEPDGSPSYSLFDPVSSQFFKINWAEATLLKNLRPGIKMSELIAEVEKNTTIRVSPEEVAMFFEQAKRSNLLAVPKPAAQVIGEADKMKVHPLKWLLFHYLYFRVPLFNPDKILAMTLPYVMLLVSPLAWVLYFVISAMGIFMLVGRLDEFFHTFPYFFSMQGAIFYSGAIIMTKVLHELAHGYVAKYYGVRVPRIGLAFIFFWPVMYTDVTDSWKMKDRNERLAITAAGIIIELILAGLCTLGWALSPPGIFQSVFFVISSITWISTVLVNVNPAMRFDGYYLFSDILGVDNLQMRSFAYTRWYLRKVFLGLDVPVPEEIVGRKRRIGMMAYTIYTWFYRLFLYTAIAIMVYTQFTKALGMFLFIVEIGVFLVWPLSDEVTKLMQMRQYFKPNVRLFSTLAVITLITTWICMPMPRTERFPAVATPRTEQVIYVPRDGKVVSLDVQRNSKVQPGAKLLTIFSKDLETQIQGHQKEKEFLQTEIDVLSEDEDAQALIPEKMAAIASIEEALRGFLEQKKQNTLYADISGTIYQFDEHLMKGRYVSKDQILGKIADLNSVLVVCFVSEALINVIEEGQEISFTTESNPEVKYKGSIERINPVRVESLKYPQLSSLYQGPLPVMPSPDRQMKMVETYYSVQIRFDDGQDLSLLRMGQTGNVKTTGKWRSLAWDFIKMIMAMFWEESSF